MDESESPLRAIFHRALEIADVHQRAAYLAEACAGDAAQRKLLEELLEAHAQAAAFLATHGASEAYAGDAAQRQLLEEPLEAHPQAGGFLTAHEDARVPPTAGISEAAGSVIGRYKLLQKIGEGGCGVVYLAEQAEPVRRRVALKIIKPGMDTRQVIARFEAERQALALMDHPNIAKVFDAGTTDTGRPFFVMELVRGVKITEYCDEARLSTQQRLELFIQVCRAVQHAHQKGIIHRDLKPSNILVTLNDGVPVPKIIDFGIAKAITGQSLTDKTIFTVFEQFIGTPAYMSPEQAVMTSVDVDTRSDIYALGVLLYELLTGKTPFDAAELLAAGLDEMRRTIREREPARPSTRLGTLPGEELSTTAQRRAVEPPRLISQLAGDLDWVVMKCLEKDRARRYETANGLARDLQRFLANEPVVARPPSKLYQFQKLVRRNKLAVAAATSLAAALVVGLGISMWLLAKERRALRRAIAAEQAQSQLRQQAESEAAKARQVSQLLKEMLSGAGPSVALGRDTTLLKEILDKTAQRLGNELTNQPEVEVELRLTLTRTYCDLGFYHQMLEMASNAAAVAQSRLPAVSVLLPKALGEIAWAQERLGRLDDAYAVRQQTVGLLRAQGTDQVLLAWVMADLAGNALARGKLEEAERLTREALALSRRCGTNGSTSLRNALSVMGQVLAARGKLDEVESACREGLALARKEYGNEHPLVATAINNLATVLHSRGKLNESEALLRESLAMERKLLGAQHPNVAIMMVNLANILAERGKTGEALSLCREAITVLKSSSSRGPELVHALQALGSILGSSDEGEQLLREALALARELSGDESAAVAESLRCLGMGLYRFKPAEAEAAFREELAIQRKLDGGDNLRISRTLGNLAEVLRQTDKLEEAEIMARQALAIQTKALGNQDPSVSRSLTRLAVVLARKGDREGAEQLFVDHSSPSGPPHISILRARAEFLARTGQWKAAIAQFTSILELEPTNHWNYHCLAPLLVAAGELDRYRQLCQRIVERFGSTSDGPTGERMAKDCLILPGSGPDLKIIGEMADKPFAIEPATPKRYYRFSKSLAEYRQVHLQSAVEWAEKVTSMNLWGGYPEVGAFMVLAMAQSKLQHPEEARAALAKGRTIMKTNLPKLESGDLGAEEWIDWLISTALIREAEALIEGNAVEKWSG